MTIGVSTFSFVNGIINRNSDVQRSLQEAQMQLATGLKSIDYKGIATNTQRLLDLESDMSRLKSQNENAELIRNRINRQNQSLTTMLDVLTAFRTDLTKAFGGGSLVTPEDLQIITESHQENFAAALNTEMGGRFLFSGTAQNVQPVDLNDPAITPQVVPTVADTAYYQGNTEPMRVQIADEVTVNMSFPASASGFEKSLRAMNLIINDPFSDAARQEARILVNESIDEITAIRTRVSSNARIVEDQMFDNDTELALLTEITSSFKDVDIAEATLRSQKLSAQLQASFAITTRALGLSLTDFLS